MSVFRQYALRALLALGALTVVGAIVATGLRLLSEKEEDAHYANGETEVSVENPAGQPFHVVKAGNDLLGSVLTIPFDPRGTWLAAGNYFVVTSHDMDTAYYPVPLTGYRSGPDAGGKFAVTIRPVPRETPPILTPTSHPYRHIPSGSFLLGDRLNPGEQHYVWLTGYFMAPFEMTNAEFKRFVEAPDGYADDRNWTEAGRQQRGRETPPHSARLDPEDRQYRRFGRPDQPATMVSWFEANAYCRWLTRSFGKGIWQFSLPTDAEWEKAARGPDNFDYGLSMTISDRETPLYNWKKNPTAEETIIGREISLTRYWPNRYGVYHMTGNVAEWTQSEYRLYSRTKPFLDDERNHDDGNARRSVRGGSWYSATNASLSIPYRDAFQPEHRGEDVGFRVVARRLP